MTDKVNVTDTVRDLVSEMLRMLIHYEIELTAYSLVLKGAQDRIIQAGIPWDMASNIRAMQGNAALQIEAEAEYAPFAALLQSMSVENLEIALASNSRDDGSKQSAGEVVVVKFMRHSILLSNQVPYSRGQSRILCP